MVKKLQHRGAERRSGAAGATTAMSTECLTVTQEGLKACRAAMAVQCCKEHNA